MKIIVVPCVPQMVGRRYNLAHTWANQGHEVHYLLWDLPYRLNRKQLLNHIKTTMVSKEYTYENFTIHKIRRLPFFWPYINGLLFKYQLRQIYKKINADFIFSQSYTNETEAPKNLPLIYDLNDDHVAMAEVYGSFIYKLAFRLLQARKVVRRQCRNAFAVTVVSEALYKTAHQYNQKVYRLPNGVNKKVIDQIKKSRVSNQKNQYSLIYVTGFNQWSRIIETMETIIKLKKEFPLIDLTLVGEGTEVKKIKKFILENQVEDYIHYLGGIYDPAKLYSLMDQASIGLNISDKNKFRDAAQPLKVLEYSALGKKVVSTDLEEVKALNFPNLYIFSDTNKGLDLPSALKMALNDPKTYSAVSKNILSYYSWENLTNELSNIINQTVET